MLSLSLSSLAHSLHLLRPSSSPLLFRYIPDISRSLTIVMQTICDKEDEQETRSSTSVPSEKDQLLRMLAETDTAGLVPRPSSSSTEPLSEPKKRKVSENILRNKLSERAKKISSESLMMFQVEEEETEGGTGEEKGKAKKRKTNASLPLVDYCLKVERVQQGQGDGQGQGQGEGQGTLVRDLPIKEESAGRWVPLKGLDSGGARIWIPNQELRVASGVSL
jgi:hypothetical protein